MKRNRKEASNFTYDFNLVLANLGIPTMNEIIKNNDVYYIPGSRFLLLLTP